MDGDFQSELAGQRVRPEVFQVLAELIRYPDSDWWVLYHEIRDWTVNRGAGTPGEAAVSRLITSFLNQAVTYGEEPLATLYVKTFDFARATNLYLTYVQYGEDRERGPALLRLKQLYAAHGCHLVDYELSDYLPVVLEFVSTCPQSVAVELLTSFWGPMASIRDALTRQENPYACLFEALMHAVDERCSTADAAPGGTLDGAPLDGAPAVPAEGGDVR